MLKGCILLLIILVYLYPVTLISTFAFSAGLCAIFLLLFLVTICIEEIRNGGAKGRTMILQSMYLKDKIPELEAEIQKEWKEIGRTEKLMVYVLVKGAGGGMHSNAVCLGN
jgi:hypothetical protein